MKSYYLILIFFIINCSSNNTKNNFEAPFEQLDAFVNDVPVLQVNIDEIPITEVVVQDKNVIYYLNENIDSLSSLSGITKMNNGFLFYDLGLKKLYKLSQDGKKVISFANEGRGPGEVNGVRHIDVNSKHIYVSDSGNRRINIYDQQLNFIRSEVELFSTEFYVNDNIYASESSSNYGAENLLSIKTIDDFTETRASLLPRLVPLGYQPTGLNGTHFALNNNRLVAAYSAIPWVFIFDNDFTLKQTLIFSKSSFDSLDTWQLTIDKGNTEKSYFGRNPITKINILENGTIIIGVRNELIILSRNELGFYEPVSRLVFKLKSKSFSEKYFGIFNKVIGADEEKIYIHNYNYLYWFNLDNKHFTNQ